jgi:hypothetical protein
MPTTNPKLEVLTPQNCQLIFIDQQPQMAFGVQSIDRQMLKNNVVGLAKAAKVFKIPATITTVESQGFSGYTFPELLDVFPEQKLLERSRPCVVPIGCVMIQSAQLSGAFGASLAGFCRDTAARLRARARAPTA